MILPSRHHSRRAGTMKAYGKKRNSTRFLEECASRHGSSCRGFSAGELDFKATPDLMSFGQLARHILDASHAVTGMLLDGVDNLATPQFREMIGKYRPPLPEQLDAATLASELRKSVETRSAELAGKGEDFFSGLITR